MQGVSQNVYKTVSKPKHAYYFKENINFGAAMLYSAKIFEKIRFFTFF